MYLQKGQVIVPADDDSKCFIVLGNYQWATLTWELETLDTRVPCFRLNSASGCKFDFVYSLHAFRAIPCAVKWLQSGEGIVLQQVGQQETLQKNCLRFSNNLTFNDLKQIASDCGIAKPSRARAELLEQLATHLGDEEFAAFVIGHDSKSSKGTITNEDFVSCLYENLDPDERGEFGAMKEAVEKKQKAATQKKWQRLLKERTDEDKANWLCAV